MNETQSLGRDGILALKEKRATHEIKVRGINAPILVRSLTYDELENVTSDAVKQLAMMLSDPSGATLFDPDNEEDLKLLKESFPAMSIREVLKAGASFNAGDADDTAKKSAASPSTDLASA